MPGDVPGKNICQYKYWIPGRFIGIRTVWHATCLCKIRAKLEDVTRSLHTALHSLAHELHLHIRSRNAHRWLYAIGTQYILVSSIDPVFSRCKAKGGCLSYESCMRLFLHEVACPRRSDGPRCVSLRFARPQPSVILPV